MSNNPPNQNMLGDLPLITSQHFLDLGIDYWKERGFSGSAREWGAPTNLERLQRLLHQKGQEKDETEEGKENNLIVESKYRTSTNYYSSWMRDNQIPYHEDILPRWEGEFYLFYLVGGY